jgi:hypothetical protein
VVTSGAAEALDADLAAPGDLVAAPVFVAPSLEVEVVVFAIGLPGVAVLLATPGKK